MTGETYIISTLRKKNWRYQMDNQKPEIMEGQRIQEEGQRGKPWSTQQYTEK